MLSDIISMLLPDTCRGCCRELLAEEKFLCLHCRHGMGRASLRAIEECRRKFAFPVEHCYAHWEFRQAGRVQRIIHDVKYGSSGRLARNLGKDMARYLPADCPGSLIAVPQHPLRSFSRGFNQAKEIAKGIAMYHGWKLEDRILKRNVNIGSQTRRNRISRMEALERSISVRKNVKEDHYILVDDVVTTGATLQQCAASLLEVSPCSRISIVVLATV